MNLKSGSACRSRQQKNRQCGHPVWISRRLAPIESATIANPKIGSVARAFRLDLWVERFELICNLTPHATLNCTCSTMVSDLNSFIVVGSRIIAMENMCVDRLQELGLIWKVIVNYHTYLFFHSCYLFNFYSAFSIESSKRLTWTRYNIQWEADLTPQYNAIYRDIMRYCKCDLLRYIAIKCDILSQNIAKIKAGARQYLFALFHVSTYCLLCK